MQSEGGAAGTLHGALQAGALATTFSSSQGLLLKIPNLYKIAGELNACCIHIAARTVATHALSIFCDHSDVMAARQTGMALLNSTGVQEAHDMALIGQAVSLDSRVPVLHFFDGFRTSHEINKIIRIDDATIRTVLDEEAIQQHRRRALTPDRPVLRGSAQNPDVFFQARESCNPFYDAFPERLQAVMARFAKATGRQYGLYEYYGHPEAHCVLIVMGSAVSAVREAVDYLMSLGQRVGVLHVRLFRPFAMDAFLQQLPASCRRIAVLDRTKEPGASAEPLFHEVLTALYEDQCAEAPRFAAMPLVVGGRYGLSSKEFNPTHAVSVFNHLSGEAPKRRFTVGIEDDVTGLSLPPLVPVNTEPGSRFRAIFFGLGADGTVSANKSSLKIIAANSERHTQGFFLYDSKKSGAITVSHLRVDDHPIDSSYLIRQAQFIACHQFSFTAQLDLLEGAAPGGVFLLNAPYPAEAVWDHLPRELQQQIIDKSLKCYAVDAHRIARDCKLAGRINTIMQTCFFALTGLVPMDKAKACIKAAIEANYGKGGPVVVQRNCAAVDQAEAGLEPIPVPAGVTSQLQRPPLVSEAAPEFVQRVTAVIMAGKGDSLPVSAFPPDGTWPTDTARWEKRNIAELIPVWERDLCTQCNLCAAICPHAAIRVKVAPEGPLEDAPQGFQTLTYKGKEFRGGHYLLQVAPEDCTGCGLCVEVCPARDKGQPRRKAINMAPQPPLREQQAVHYGYFLSLPEADRSKIQRLDIRTSQLLQPLFEYSGACAGCGETPYLKMLTQLFGDRLLIANATGCSSIYGGNLPTTPWATNAAGRGPAWSNSLFEDNAEFGLGFRLAITSHHRHAVSLLQQQADQLESAQLEQLFSLMKQTDVVSLERLREQITDITGQLTATGKPLPPGWEQASPYLVDKSVWIVGGDGWAYDIGFGGLDHVMSLMYNVNVLVMDTQCYSNTGGQMSKATPLGASARFASHGKPVARKDLGLEMIMLGHVYVAQIALGANKNQAVKAFLEAQDYPGPSLLIAYSPCVAHGYDLSKSVEHQQILVESGLWPLFRFDPRRIADNQAPLQLDTKKQGRSVKELMDSEARFKVIARQSPESYGAYVREAQQQAARATSLYRQLAQIHLPASE
jgi:pyruvate-ferredoxin/flavodoxin oxidoreductase